MKKHLAALLVAVVALFGAALAIPAPAQADVGSFELSLAPALELENLASYVSPASAAEQQRAAAFELYTVGDTYSVQAVADPEKRTVLGDPVERPAHLATYRVRLWRNQKGETLDHPPSRAVLA